MSLLIWLLWLGRFKLATIFNWKLPQKKSKVELPSFSRSYEKKVLPSDIPQALATLFAEKSFRQLLSLLLVSSLTQLHQKNHLVLKESMTELECLDAICKVADADVQEFMNHLIHTWIALAWAHQNPAELTMQTLCDNWNKVFSESISKPS